MKQPIVILAMPRSGSSMTAGIFAGHGVWFGRCTPPRPHNPKGFFENIRIKNWLAKRYGRLTLARSETDLERAGHIRPVPGLLDEVRLVHEDEEYDGGPWAFKVSVLYRDAFFEFTPTFIGVRRRAVVDANLDRQTLMMGTEDRGRVERMVEIHERMIAETGCPVVQTDEVVAGDYSSLRAAFDYCSIPFNPAIADEFVDPSLWHHT